MLYTLLMSVYVVYVGATVTPRTAIFSFFFSSSVRFLEGHRCVVMAAVSTPQNPALQAKSGAARRTSASRAVAAVQETFPIILSPSPLLRLEALPTGKPKPITRYRSVKELEAAFTRPDPLATEQARLAEFHTIVKGRTTLLSLADDALGLVYRFLGDNSRHFTPLSRVCKRMYHLSFGLETSVTLVPTLVSAESLSRPGSMHSLALHLGRYTRGPYVESFSILDSKAVAQLPRTLMGPEISKIGLQCVLANTQHLLRLDVRGVLLRDHSPVTDRFLADLHVVCPQLEQLRVGVSLARCWEVGWWGKLPHLKEFVVGSRREDVDWADSSPLALHEDAFAMLRSPHHTWRAVKFWCQLVPASFQQLVNPSISFPELRHLAVNATGNTSTRPLEDLSSVSAADGGAAGDKKKADAKSAKKGAAEDTQVLRCPFPTLESFTVADVAERPDFASELAAKLLVTAPNLSTFNITNTHRNAPTKAPPATGKPKRGA